MVKTPGLPSWLQAHAGLDALGLHAKGGQVSCLVPPIHEVDSASTLQDSMYIVAGNGAFQPSRGLYGDSVIRFSLPDLSVRILIYRAADFHALS